MTLPNFLIIGAARCGTTALYGYMAQHPEVYLSSPKEPHFFAFAGRTVSFTGPGDDETINRTAVTDFDEYRRLFDGAGGAKAIGEASVSSLYYPEAADSIRAHVPDARLICVLRNPADRAFSAFCYERSRMFEPQEDFATALGLETERLRAGWHHIWHYKRQGLYFEQLKRFFDRFERSQIKVVLYESELRQNRSATLSDCFSFVGVSEDHRVDAPPLTPASGEPRIPWLQRMLTGYSPFKRAIAERLPRRLWLAAKQHLLAANVQRRRMDPKLREVLELEFRDDVLRLQDLIERDLSEWLPV